jgi:hypothetical protein
MLKSGTAELFSGKRNLTMLLSLCLLSVVCCLLSVVCCLLSVVLVSVALVSVVLVSVVFVSVCYRINIPRLYDVLSR